MQIFTSIHPIALDSIFTQTYPHWHLTIWDDGSTDSSPAIAREYAQLGGNALKRRGLSDRYRLNVTSDERFKIEANVTHPAKKIEN